MARQIIPSLIAKNQKELDKRIEKVSAYFSRFQLDVMDGKFVKNRSLMFDFRVPGFNRYEAHLMVKNPEKWVEENHEKVSMIIFHIESTDNPAELIKLIRNKKKYVGIAVKPDTDLERIFPYMNKLNMVLVLGVHPGRYGARFLPRTMKKVRQIRKLNPRIDIEVDGGMNERNIRKALKAGANKFSVGSYFQKSKDIEKSIDKLNEEIVN